MNVKPEKNKKKPKYGSFWEKIGLKKRRRSGPEIMGRVPIPDLPETQPQLMGEPVVYQPENESDVEGNSETDATNGNNDNDIIQLAGDVCCPVSDVEYDSEAEKSDDEDANNVNEE